MHTQNKAQHKTAAKLPSFLSAVMYQVTHVSFGWRQAELDEANLGLLQASHAAAGHLLGQNQALHQLAVINGPSETRHRVTGR